MLYGLLRQGYVTGLYEHNVLEALFPNAVALPYGIMAQGRYQFIPVQPIGVAIDERKNGDWLWVAVLSNSYVMKSVCTTTYDSLKAFYQLLAGCDGNVKCEKPGGKGVVFRHGVHLIDRIDFYSLKMKTVTAMSSKAILIKEEHDNED